mgnify:CR=1 FL=1
MDIKKLQHLKIKREKVKELTEDEKDILKLAKTQPGNTRIQNYRMKLLKKNNMLDAKEECSDDNVGYSDGESYD